MYGFAHGVMAGVIITFVLFGFILAWIYVAECKPPKKREVAKVSPTEGEEELSACMCVFIMGAFFIISFHLTLWTWGIAILARKRMDIKLTPKKIFINFGTVPSVIGISVFLMNVEIPKFPR